MRTAKTLTILAFLGVGAGSVLVAGCGDNAQTCGPGTEPNEDGICLPTGEGGPDAEPNPDDPDAEPAPDADESETVSGTIAVVDTLLTDPSAFVAPFGSIRGGAIRMSFNDLTDTSRGGTTVFGTSPVGGCLVTKYDASHPPFDRLDGGTVNLSGSALLKTVGPCDLRPELGDPDPYMCVSNESASALVIATTTTTPGAVAYTFPTIPFGMTTPVAIANATRGAIGGLPPNVVQVTTAAPHGYKTGQFVVIAGMTPTTFNTPVTSGISSGVPISVTGANTFLFAQAGSQETGSANGTASAATNAITGSSLIVNMFTAGPNAPLFSSGSGTFPVVAQIGPNTVLVLNTATGALAAGTATTGANASFAFLNATSPVPTTTSFTNFHDFLGSGSLVIAKAAVAGVWGAINETIDIPGEAPAAASIMTLARTGGNLVTATMAAGHGITKGQTVTIAASVPPTLGITGVARVSAVVVVTTSGTHDLLPGDSVLLAGITPIGATSFNGAFQVLASPAPTATTFAVFNAAVDDTGTGGTTTLKSFNGTFVVTSASATSFTYTQTGNNVTAAAAGTAQKTSFRLDTSQVLASGSGTGPAFTAGCTITNTGMFAAGLAGNTVTIAGSTTAANNGTFPVTASTVNDITYTNAACAAEAFVAGTSYTVDSIPSTVPHFFPSTAMPLNYSCDNNTPSAVSTADDTCGVQSTSGLKALIISGTATKKSLVGLFPFQMPKEVSGDSEWVEWQCGFLVPNTTADIPMAAVQAILDFKPTRIETQVLFVAGNQLSDGFNLANLNVVAGHALAGHQTMCPAAGPGLNGFGQSLCGACNDGIDNDGDNAIDFAGSDAGCTSASDTSE